MICPYCTRNVRSYYVASGGGSRLPDRPAGHRCRECSGTCPGGPLPTLRPRKVCACHGALPQPEHPTESKPKPLSPFLSQLRRLVVEAGVCAQSSRSKTPVFAQGYPHAIWGGRHPSEHTDGSIVYTDSFEISSTAYGYDISRNGVGVYMADSLDEAVDLVIASYKEKA
jgi:hypothetical protein